MIEKFPEALPFFRKFLSLKSAFMKKEGQIYLWSYIAAVNEFGKNWRSYSRQNSLSLTLFDLREAPRRMDKKDNIEKPFFQAFLTKLRVLKSPSMKDPTVWLWISSTEDRHLQAVVYAQRNMREYYIAKDSKYYPSKFERLYDQTTRQSSAIGAGVYLLFMVKKDSPQFEAKKKRIKKEYRAADVPYYSESRKYMEAKYRLHNSELRMEFYFELLQTFCYPGKNFLSILSGSKCMLAARVSIQIFVT
jgi:hypothetical protein